MKKVNLVLLATLAGCSNDPSQATMISLAEKSAALPSCPGAAAKFIERDPGGGFQGGWILITIDVSDQCMTNWRRSLDRQCEGSGNEFRCTADDQITGGEVEMLNNRQASVRLWSLT